MGLGKLSASVTIPFVVFGFCSFTLAQGPLPDAPSPTASAALVASVGIQPIVIQPIVVQPIVQRKTSESPHRFWDTENRVLLLSAGVMNGADFAVTRANLQNGGHELNPIVRLFGSSTPGLAANFAGETASIVSMSYFFHKTGHHKLERAVSIVNIGCSAGAVTYGLTHRGAKVTTRF